VNIDLPVVVYDACVLYPALLRDFLMQLGLAKCLLPKWSRRIQEEWKRNLLKNRLDLSRSTLDRTTRLMEAAIPSALVEPPEELIASLQLPDPDDRHVLATAIQSRASIIMTFNTRDFPESALIPFRVVVLHPDEIVVNLIGTDRDAVIRAAQTQRAQLVRPIIGRAAYLDMLCERGLVQTSTLLANYADRI